MLSSRFRYMIAWIGCIIGLVCIGSGLFIHNILQWRLQLLLGLWFVVLPLSLVQQRWTGVARGLGHLMLFFGLGFSAVALQLVREQIVQADATRTRIVALFPSAPEQSSFIGGIRTPDRTALGNEHYWSSTINVSTRGKIVDRNGVVLATNEQGRRVYPHADVGHIVGFQSQLYGVTGIEASFDELLSGLSLLAPLELLEARLVGAATLPSTVADVYLTLDLGLQRVAQEALGEQAGAVVLLDPQTGAILALATYPRFDPNQLILPLMASDADVAQVQSIWQALTTRTDSPLLNRATQGRYPPGSVIKTLTAAAALDSGVVAGPEGRVTCPNQLSTEAGAPPVVNAVNNLSRYTGDPSDLRRVYAFSCNTAFAQLGLALGPERYGLYAERFGLGYADIMTRTTDLRDTPASAGTIASSSTFLKRPAALADTAFGQGQILITPLDMAQMVAVIANGGQLMRPYIAQEVRVGQAALRTTQTEVLRSVITAQTAEQMREIMRQSVEIGYAKPVGLPGVAIGAKTGTAETPSGAPHSWFVALAPVEQPRFAIAVVVEHSGEGSRFALPVARQVLAAALGIKP